VTDSSAHGSAGVGADSQAIMDHYVCSSNELPGYSVHRSLGVVNGITVRSRNVARALGAIGKSLVGGEIRNWTKLCEDARQEAYTRMLAEAVARGADGVIGMRYSTNEVKDGVTEVIAYGTAVSSNPDSSAAAASEGYPAGGPQASTAPVQGVPLHMVTTSDKLPGLNICHSNFFQNFGAGLKAGIVGGKIHTWVTLCEQSRLEATERLVEEAAKRGAKGIVGMRYETNEISPGMSETIAFGTTVA